MKKWYTMCVVPLFSENNSKTHYLPDSQFPQASSNVAGVQYDQRCLSFQPSAAMIPQQTKVMIEPLPPNTCNT